MLSWLRNADCGFEWGHEVIEAELKFGSNNLSHSGDEAQGLELEWLILLSDSLVEVAPENDQNFSPVSVDDTAVILTFLIVLATVKQAIAEIKHGKGSLCLQL